MLRLTATDSQLTVKDEVTVVVTGNPAPALVRCRARPPGPDRPEQRRCAARHQAVDLIRGEKGNDVLTGRGASDCLAGGPGRDAVRGNGGGDVLRGNGGSDRLDGGAGADRLNPGRGKDQVDSGGGDDRVNSVDGKAAPSCVVPVPIA